VNGVHDLGGMHGMGAIARDADEPAFHLEWERRAFAITLAAGFLGEWNIDMTRFARERMPPAEYLASTYYEHWLFGLEWLLVEHGLVARAEIEARRRAAAPPAGSLAPTEGHRRLLRAADVDPVLRKGSSARVPVDVPARFAPGAAVVARNIHPVGHTRLPRYVRGRRGLIDRDHGVFIFPDTHALGQGAKPQHLYSVRFALDALWGTSAAPGDAVYVDLWDDYLDAA
jgi:nitrile hydratase subunit beta